MYSWLLTYQSYVQLAVISAMYSWLLSHLRTVGCYHIKAMYSWLLSHCVQLAVISLLCTVGFYLTAVYSWLLSHCCVQLAVISLLCTVGCYLTAMYCWLLSRCVQLAFISQLCTVGCNLTAVYSWLLSYHSYIHLAVITSQLCTECSWLFGCYHITAMYRVQLAVSTSQLCTAGCYHIHSHVQLAVIISQLCCWLFIIPQLPKVGYYSVTVVYSWPLSHYNYVQLAIESPQGVSFFNNVTGHSDHWVTKGVLPSDISTISSSQQLTDFRHCYKRFTSLPLTDL